MAQAAKLLTRNDINPTMEQHRQMFAWAVVGPEIGDMLRARSTTPPARVATLCRD